MSDIIVEIMVEVLTILAIATKEAKRGRFSEFDLKYIRSPLLTGSLEKFLKKLVGNSEIEDSLGRLDRLTQEEARMASAEQLKMTHGVDDRVRGVEGQVQDVGNKVQGVDDRVQDIGSNISNKVQGVDDKLDQVNSSLSP
jgi:hypothetical protein